MDTFICTDMLTVGVKTYGEIAQFMMELLLIFGREKKESDKIN